MNKDILTKSIHDELSVEIHEILVTSGYNPNEDMDGEEFWLLVKGFESLLSRKLIEAPNTDKVTRVEVIDENGRSCVNWNDKNKVELSFQDDERTLKIFISKRN